MLKKVAFGLLVLSVYSGFATESKAQSPYEFQFGYALGMQNSFRNRLPVPPYFSIYPPVYYGKRYARPFGESPYASWPLLRSSPDYYAQPVGGAAFTSRTVSNPHVVESVQIQQLNADESKPLPETVPAAPVQPVVIVNPFVNEQFASR